MSILDNKVNINAFNEWSETYDQGRTVRWFRYIHQLVINQMKLREDSRVLDVGCGTGLAVSKISLLLPKGKACGLDISVGMIERSREKTSPFGNLEFKIGDAEKIPYPSDYFDYVFSVHSFHHYSDPVLALKEIKRVLKEGGKLLIAESCRNSSVGVRLFDFYHKLFEKGHIRYYSEDEMIEFYKQAGFAEARMAFLEHNYFKYGKIISSTMIIKGVKRDLSSKKAILTGSLKA